MIEIKYKNYDSVKPMLEDVKAGFTYFKAVVDGNHTGKIFVDNEQRPTEILIWAPYQYSCLVGAFNDNGFVNSAVGWLDEQASKRHGYHCLVVHPSNEDKFLNIVNSEFRKLELSSKIHSTRTESACRNICDGKPDVEIVFFTDLNKEMSCEAGKLVGVGKLCWDNYDDLVKRGRAKALLLDSRVVGICVSAWVSGNEEEVWINIDEEYRGKGLSPVLAATYVLDSIKDGCTPIWQTTKDNIASIKLAEMLEMQAVSSPVVLFRDVPNA